MPKSFPEKDPEQPPGPLMPIQDPLWCQVLYVTSCKALPDTTNSSWGARTPNLSDAEINVSKMFLIPRSVLTGSVYMTRPLLERGGGEGRGSEQKMQLFAV